MSQQPAAGWYPDPSGAPGQKYWDGRQWLELPPAPPAPPAPYGVGAGYFGVDPYGRPLSDKSKLVAGLLQLFLGGIGVGRFYLGYIGIGFAQIAITVFTLGFAGWIWPLIDAILILTGKVTDAEGRTLRD
ncbi:NINE protein [Candidatus Mycobacterium wuenschmannii]|uniref:NINE protein n=1 Tax=Candidatus Mycobacterium wuenschmannii TaxID=3027808 RepID=A0ABY8W457_9MYCO|nr:NINE protein [Candidatus Mycobacterium wuenschmannii]WIM88554.1 NINE protein [Candidatus Mycobacterium wuenschmannii]